MGRSYTPKYRLEYRDNSLACRKNPHYFHWMCLPAGFGVPTERKLSEYRRALNTSFAPGGVNDHVSEGAGFVIHVGRVRAVEQKTGRVVAETVAPMFEVV